MSYDYSHYLKFLATEYNILYIGRNSEAIYDETSSYFKSSSKVDLNKEILEKINTVLMKRHINIVLIDVPSNDEMARDLYRSIREFNPDILIMMMFNPQKYNELFEIVPLVDALVSYPIMRDMFHRRLFSLLSQIYAINSIGRRDIILKHDNVVEDVIDVFFDKYEGSSLFIADDLMEMVNALNAGNLTHSFFINIASELEKVADIFSHTEQTKSVSPIYIELATYLRDLNLSNIQPENLEGFTYLSEILSDVSVYLMDMFVDRIFKDVSIFEYSLISNIEFMKNRLNGKQEDEGNIDFF